MKSNLEAQSCHPQLHGPRRKVDRLFWSCAVVVVISYLAHFLGADKLGPTVGSFTESIYSVMNQMWWGLLVGIFFVGVLNQIPREFVMAALGRKRGLAGILRATALGLTLDLCSHGILLVGTKLYERGATLGQTMAFLIASPWNSLSLTVILISLIGLKWTLTFIVLSAVIAIVSGLIFDRLEEKKILPRYLPQPQFAEDFHFFKEARTRLKQVKFDHRFFVSLAIGGIKESRMILRWIFFGAILAGFIRTFIPEHIFHQFFGPSFLGLALTLVAATVIEVCSEGATPIAADIFRRALAPGNAFVFLMAGVSTDYTTILSLKEVTRSWKVALYLPLVTLPQILAIGWVMNP